MGDNVLALGQVADFADALLDAVKGDTCLPDEPVATHDLQARAVAKALDQLHLDVRTLAELKGLNRPREIPTAIEAVEFSLGRLSRFCELTTQSPVVPDWDTHIDRIADVTSRIARLDAAMTTELAEWLKRLRGSAVSHNADEAGGSDAIRSHILTLINALEPIWDGMPESSDRECAEAALVAHALRGRCRSRLVEVLTPKSFEQISVDNGDTPAHPYVLYWALAGLRGWSGGDEVRPRLLAEARVQYFRELARSGTSASTDAVRLGYHAALEIEFEPAWDRQLVELAIRCISDLQHEDGRFERLERMWLTERGDAYGVDTELLTTLLIGLSDEPRLLSALEPLLRRTLKGLSERCAPSVSGQATDGAGNVWADGTSSSAKPQAWLTGEVYSFLYLTERYLSRACADLAIERFGGKRSKTAIRPVSYESSRLASMTADFWGSDGSPLVGEQLYKSLCKPLLTNHRYFGTYSLAAQADRRDHTRSGILFGPPGTGKTSIAESLAEFLGWPLVALSPFDFLKDGIEGVPRAANEAFSWLSQLQDCVVLIDEMEEFVRSRSVGSNTGVRNLGRVAELEQILEALASTATSEHVEQDPPSYIQRLWTTLFLPLTQRLWDEAGVVFLVATNHFDRIDPAIARRGRFDFHILMLPPSTGRKVELFLRFIETELGLTPDETYGLLERLTSLLSEPHWLVRDKGSDAPWRAEHEPEADQVEFATCVIERVNGGQVEGHFPIGHLFRWFNRGDVRDLATSVVSQLRREQLGDQYKERIESALLQSLPAIAPTGFHYEPGKDYLADSKLKRSYT